MNAGVFIIGGVVAGISIGAYAARRFRRYKNGKTAPERFKTDMEANRSYNDEWLLNVEDAIQVGKPLEELPSWRIGGCSAEPEDTATRSRFAAAVMAYDKAVGRT